MSDEREPNPTERPMSRAGRTLLSFAMLGAMFEAQMSPREREAARKAREVMRTGVFVDEGPLPDK